MTIQRNLVGRSGEDAAAAYLIKHGYRLLNRNFRSIWGEIDIIAADGDTICFVEVKTRRSERRGSPFESITPSKQRKLAKTALGYLKAEGKTDARARFDVVAVSLSEPRTVKIELLKNAFDVV